VAAPLAALPVGARRSLEEPELVEGAERFVVNLMRSSEDLDPEADSPDPDLAPVEFDDEAMAEALAEARWDDADDVD
jgi:hypothetical protein